MTAQIQHPAPLSHPVAKPAPPGPVTENAGCCGPVEQASCCEPQAKATCCTPDHGEGCGCR